MTHQQRAKGSEFVQMLTKLTRAKYRAKPKPVRFPIEEVTELQAKGCTILEIAQKLSLSVGAIKYNLKKEKAPSTTAMAREHT